MSMNDAEMARAGFIRQRRAGIAAITAAMPVALLLWLAIAYLTPPLEGMASLDGRMLFTLKCCCLAVLFCLVTGVEAVAHERLFSLAFDPLAGFETRRLRVNQRYLQNTVQQILVFAVGLFGLAAYSPDGSAMRAVMANDGRLDTGSLRFLDRLSSQRRHARHWCTGNGAQSDRLALRGGPDRLRSRGHRRCSGSGHSVFSD